MGLTNFIKKARAIYGAILNEGMGESGQWQDRYTRLYGPGDYSEQIDRSRNDIYKRYRLVLILTVVVMGLLIVKQLMPPYSGLEMEADKIVSVDRPADGDELVLETELELVKGKSVQRADVIIHIEPQVDGEKVDSTVARGEDKSEAMGRLIDEAVAAVEDNPARRLIVLPKKLEDGTLLSWRIPDEKQNWVMLLVGPLMLLWLYRSRFDRVARLEKQARESVITELPEFINKLILLMNSGLVFYSAFERIIREMDRDSGADNYFYSQLIKLYERNRETRSGFGRELLLLSKNTGVKEFIRVTNVINDNLSKGSPFVAKLEAENDMLWFARKKQAEEKGRLAETKMTLPLVILLLVLILITIAPAMMEM